MTFQRNALLAAAIGLALAAGVAPFDAAARQQDHKAQHDKSEKDGKSDKAKKAGKSEKSSKSDKGGKHADKSEHRDDGKRQAAHVEHRKASRPDKDIDRAPAPQYRDDDRARRAPTVHPSARALEVRQREEAHARNAQRAEARRISSAERQRMIALQQQREADYRRHLDALRAAESRRLAAIDAQRRAQQARYLDWYWAQQRAMAARWSPRDYDRDPYFNAAPTYRYYRDGRAYAINQYAADVLRDAVRNGYEMGVRAGNADRIDGWRSDWRNNFAYRDANYGYNGWYVDQDDYNHYFRQGFQRGYQDAYGNDWEYGRRTGGNDTATILASVLQAILGLQTYR